MQLHELPSIGTIWRVLQRLPVNVNAYVAGPRIRYIVKMEVINITDKMVYCQWLDTVDRGATHFPHAVWVRDRAAGLITEAHLDLFVSMGDPAATTWDIPRA